jgi:hypothetical protein
MLAVLHEPRCNSHAYPVLAQKKGMAERQDGKPLARAAVSVSRSDESRCRAMK